MAAGPKIKYDEGVEKFANFLTRLQGGEVKKANSQAARTISFRIRDMVKDEYRKHIKGGTLRGIARSTRLVGKEKGQGQRPAREPRGPGTDAALLSRNIKVTKISNVGYHIEPDPGMNHPDTRPGYPNGVPLGLLAYWMENPKPYMVPYTLRMMVYLKMVRKGEGGLGTKMGKTTLPYEKTLETFMVKPPSRPVWSTVGKQLKQMTPLYTRDLAKRLSRLAKRFGLEWRS